MMPEDAMADRGVAAGRRIVLMGPPASGKGTQAEMLAKSMGLPLIVTGEMLRRSAAAGTPAGLEAKTFMDQGLLVPDEVLNRLVGETLAGEEYRQGVILDGYPRTIAQADFLAALWAAEGTGVSHALFIQVPDEHLVRRQAGRLICRSCGRVYNRYSLPPAIEGRCDCGGDLYQRSDDSEETIRKRLLVYRELTAQLVDYYAAQGVLHVIDGVGAPDEVAERIASAVARGQG
jgi:adenylate kinase